MKSLASGIQATRDSLNSKKIIKRQLTRFSYPLISEDTLPFLSEILGATKKQERWFVKANRRPGAQQAFLFGAGRRGYELV
jgi:hypothetical protein